MREEDYKAIVVEGYECTGKSTYIKSLMEKEDMLYYRPSYEELSLDKMVPRKHRYILGLVTLDLMKQNSRVLSKTILLDRSLPSSLVYSKLYNDVPFEDMLSVVESYMKVYSEIGVKFIYKYHKSIDDARLLYNRAMETRTELDKYDCHDSFEDYYEKYLQFHDEFMKAFRFLGVKVTFVPSVMDEYVVDFSKGEDLP